MIRALTLLVLLVSMLSLASCRSRAVIDAEAIAPLLEDVTQRHDIYVVTDPTITVAERDIYLESSALLRQVVEEARGTVTDPSAPPAPGS